MSEGTSEAFAAKKRKLEQRFRPEYCIEFPSLMKSTKNRTETRPNLSVSTLSSLMVLKTYITSMDKKCYEHTYTTKQLKSAKLATYQAFQNYTLIIILWEDEGGPLQEILISIDSKLKHRIHL
jgi:hypothetical protein